MSRVYMEMVTVYELKNKNLILCGRENIFLSLLFPYGLSNHSVSPLISHGRKMAGM